MNGIIVIDKPPDWTSHDVVAKLRGVLKTRKIGHAGTLDPFATGVLVVCVGLATRLVQFLIGLEKEYLATVRLGFATDTQDRTGKPITPLQSSKALSDEDIRRVLATFKGEQAQLPPMYSAKKIDGVTLHRAARAGQTVEREPVRITVYEIALVDGGLGQSHDDGTRDFRMQVRCSSGTYIRTLAHDIGSALGTGAHLSALRRLAVGPFTISQALTLRDVEERVSAGVIEQDLISLSDCLPGVRRMTILSEEVHHLVHGRAIILHQDRVVEVSSITASTPPDLVRLCNQEGGLIAIGEMDRAEMIIRPKVVFHSVGIN